METSYALPTEVVDKYWQLSDSGDQFALMRHVWEWTRNPDNPDRVSRNDFYRLVSTPGRTAFRDKIKDLAVGWEIWEQNNQKLHWEDCPRLAHMNEDKRQWFINKMLATGKRLGQVLQEEEHRRKNLARHLRKTVFDSFIDDGGYSDRETRSQLVDVMVAAAVQYYPPLGTDEDVI